MTLTGKHHPRNIINRAVFGAASVLVLLTFPGSTFMASTVSATSPTCTPVSPASSGTTKPTGSSAHTYSYNQCTGLWENTHYTYNPSTRQYAPKPGSEPVYTCDKSTYTWKVTQWAYVASQGQYQQQTSNASSAPAGSGTCVAPAPSPQASNPAANGTNNPSAGSTINGSNTNSTNENDNTSVTLTNNIGSQANSGDVLLNQNTSAGNALSGNALANSTIINSVNSSSSLNGGQVVIFTKDINGDVNGDLIINPNQLQPASVNLNNTNNLTLNSQTSGTINNNVTLNAKSGDVTAKQNTEVGDATSGNASAVANVVNMLNSMVSANQSFIGTININGNLHGNILMPPKFLDGLIASGAPHTNVNINTTNTANLTDNSVTNIENQINSQATSGTVNSSKNTEAGNATSGSASTNVEVYNLTGHQIIGANSLLVFVNVTGKWVGVIVDAPTGSNSAALGGNITANTTNNTTVNASTNNSINNNINVNAASGNVNSSENTQAGNATSGNATTSVSLANISNDSLTLSGWFGVLFINVYGNWFGNFGSVAATHTTAAGSSHRGQAASPGSQPTFSFIPGGGIASSAPNGGSSSFTSSSSPASDPNSGITLANQLLGDSSSTPFKHFAQAAAKSPNPSDSTDSNHSYLLSVALIAVGFSMFVAERVTKRHS